MFEQVDHTICGRPCESREVPEEIKRLNEEFKDVFPDKIPKGLPKARATDHRINLKEGSHIPVARMYRSSPEEGKVQNTHVDDLLANGFTQPSNSPFGAGVLLVPKAGGKWRMCVDYRPLNAITVADVYPLPRIDEMIDTAGRAQ